jgi:hypothetical protein
MIGMFLGLVPPWVVAYLAVRWIELPPTPWRTLFRAALATGLAIGLSSLTFFLWAVCVGPRRPGLFLAELLLFGAWAWVWWRGGRVCPLMTHGIRGLTPPARLKWALVFVLLCAVGVSGWYLWHSPHGDWDAWAIWNLRARFLARGGEHWTAAFSPLIFWSHPDYPLLLPGAVARCWLLDGQETTLAPRLIACLFGGAAVALLMAVLALLRGPTPACLAGIMLLATPYFLELMTAQYADVPLSFFILASAALFEIHDEGGGMPTALLAGVFTGLAAWTKNEGLLALAVAGVIRIVLAARRPRRAMLRQLAAVALGSLPVMGVLLYFKLRLAPRNDLLDGQGRQATLARLSDASRYALIAGHFLGALLKIGPGAVVLLACYRVLLGRPPRRPNCPRGLHTLTFVGLMLLGYAIVYLTTPSELSWHLRYSIDRLFMQLWPTALLAFFLITATPEEAAQRAASSDPRKVNSLDGTATDTIE